MDYPICSGAVKWWLMDGIGGFDEAWTDKLDSPIRLAKRLDKMGYKRM